MLKNTKKYQEMITDMTNEYVYNLGKSGEVGANYIIQSIEEKIKERREQK